MSIYDKLPNETIEQYYARLPGSAVGSATTGVARSGIDKPTSSTIVTSEPARVNFNNNVNTLPKYENNLVAGQSSSMTIQPGQTLSQIARDSGTTVQDILKLNPSIKNPDVIQAGAQLNLPSSQGAITLKSGNPAMQSLITQANQLIQKAGNNLSPESRALLESINNSELTKTANIARAREAADTKDSLSLDSALKSVREIEKDQQNNLDLLFEQLKAARTDMLGSSIMTDKEKELQSKLNTLRTERQLLPIELRNEGISAEGIASRQVEDERVRAIQESNLLLELGLEQDARKIKAGIAEKNYSFIKDDIELQNKVIEKLAEQEKQILDSAKNMNKDQLSSLKSILDSFEGLEWADLDATTQSQLSELAKNNNIPIELLSSALKNAKQQAIISKEKKVTPAKVDTITVDERKRLYPSLPVSLIGQDEKQVLSQLESSNIPQWYREMKRGDQQATPVITQDEWDTFRKSVIRVMTQQVQKNVSYEEEI